jgi:hypothetical protein
MPQLALLAALGVGAYAGFRWLKRAAETISADMKTAEARVRERDAAGRLKDLGQLEYDPVSGLYRPIRRD